MVKICDGCQAKRGAVSYHKLFDVLKQFQNEVNDIRSERLARSANPLALLSPMQVNVQFLQQLQPEWSRFVTVVKQRQEIEKENY
ncbi:hypothetical protein Tco_1171058 [Tanacetum coccineum]